MAWLCGGRGWWRTGEWGQRRQRLAIAHRDSSLHPHELCRQPLVLDAQVGSNLARLVDRGGELGEAGARLDLWARRG
eukprot:COSAG06_NODE_12598_length_1358_cov_1.138205_1_plen_76_part_10